MAIRKILGLLGVDTGNGGPFTSNLKFTGGGTDSADVNTLDHYEELVATPALNFGGGSVGITYSSRGATVTRIGNMVLYTISLILTSKGSSTGNLQITGLPITVGNTANFPAAIHFTAVASGLGDTHIAAVAVANTTTLRIYKYVAGVETMLTDADLTDTTTIRITGHYRV